MKGIFSFKIPVWIFLSCIFYGTQAALKTHYVNDLCYYKDSATIHLRHAESGILTSLSNGQAISCSIRLNPYSGNFVVLSIYRYQLDSEDELIIEDSDRHKIAIIGYGDFSDERKSIISNGPLTIYFSSNNTKNFPGQTRVSFQFTFTHGSESPCGYSEYQCRNRICIPKNLLCDRHNHCGDNSDQENCAPKNDFDVSENQAYRKSSSSLPLIAVIVLSVISVIVFVVIIACAIRFCVVKRKVQGPSLPTVAAAVPVSSSTPTESNPPQAPPSVFSQIRRSIRHLRHPKPEVQRAEEQKSENYEVPSMYPQIPSAPELTGIENADFKVEE